MLCYFEEEGILSMEELFIKARDSRNDLSLECDIMGMPAQDIIVFFEKIDDTYTAILSMKNLLLKANSRLSQVSVLFGVFFFTFLDVIFLCALSVNLRR